MVSPRRGYTALTEAMVRDAVEAEGLIYERPPYGRSIRSAIVSLITEAAMTGICRGIVVPARPDTGWFHDFCAPQEVRFLKGRIRFDGEKSGAPFPSAIVVVGPAARRGSVRWWDIRTGELT